jgi:hypothetical protein
VVRAVDRAPRWALFTSFGARVTALGALLASFGARVTALGALLAAGLMACSVAPPKSQFPNARAALDRVHELHACSRALRGEAKLDYFDDNGRIRVKTLYITQHPSSVRFDLMSPFGAPVATLTSNGERFTLLDQKEKAFFEGPARECNVERFLRVPIPPEALVRLLAGEAPVLVHQPESSSIDWEDGRYVIRIQSKHQAEQRIAVEVLDADYGAPYSAQRVRVTEVEVSQAGVVLYSVRLSDHEPARTAKPLVDPDGLEPPLPPSGPACQAEVPRRVHFTVPLSERDVLFEQKEVEHNPPLIDGVFDQQQPRGTLLRRAQCR